LAYDAISLRRLHSRWYEPRRLIVPQSTEVLEAIEELILVCTASETEEYVKTSVDSRSNYLKRFKAEWRYITGRNVPAL
jgi:hypothetical protein